MPGNPSLSLAVRGLPPGTIRVPDGGREISETAVVALMESIRAIGQQTPIAIERRGDTGFWVVFGRHRHAACLRLGIEVACIILDEKCDAELWEITENLHRAELTELERRELNARWANRVAGEIAADQLRQVDAIEKPVSKRADGKGHRPAGGTREEARRMGIAEPTLRRAKATAAIESDAKAVIKANGLEDNGSVLDRVASAPREQQVEVAQTITAEKARYAPIKGAETPKEPQPTPESELVRFLLGRMPRAEVKDFAGMLEQCDFTQLLTDLRSL